MATARARFDEGLRHLGMHPGHRGQRHSVERAGVCFGEAVHADAGMCDGWLGLAYAQGANHHNLAGALAAARNMYRETRRLGVDDGVLAPVITTPIGGRLDIVNRYALTAAYAGLLIADQRFDDAEKLLADSGNPADVHITLMTAILHRVTERWPDVIAVVERGDRPADVHKAATVDVLVAHASVMLGQFGHALSKAEFAAQYGDAQTAAAAAVTAAMALRCLGRADEARTWLGKAVVDGELVPEAAKLASDETWSLVPTSAETIAARANKWDPASGPTLGELEREKQRCGDADLLAEGEAEIDAHVGLPSVKQRLREEKRAREYDMAMRAGGEDIGDVEGMNMTFVGQPGTAKTSIARCIGKVYCGLGLLKSPAVHEVSRRMLVGEHVGETAIRTGEWLEKARNATLFIDEAHELWKPHTRNDFGVEVIDTINKFAEDNRDDILIILAGYPEPINDMLDNANAGFRSRFPVQLEFPSYTTEELVQIAYLVASDSAKVTLASAAVGYMEVLFAALTSRREDINPHGGDPRLLIDRAANGRFVRMLMTEAARHMKNRVMTDPSIDLGSPEGRAKARILSATDLHRAAGATLLAQNCDPALADLPLDSTPPPVTTSSKPSTE